MDEQDKYLAQQLTIAERRLLSLRANPSGAVCAWEMLEDVRGQGDQKTRPGTE